MQHYPSSARTATQSLADALATRIRNGGPMSFAAFMEAALYDPQQGYYASRLRRIGREGDFFTSVSVGALFGQLLARRFLAHHRDLGRPHRWRIIECGAHDGTLAADVLDAIATLDPDAFAALGYAIVEPLASLRDAQHRTLARHRGRVVITQDPDALAATPLPGIAFGNEVLDALPCHVVEQRGGTWTECLVDHNPQLGWFWTTGSAVNKTLAAMLPAADAVPDGWRTEVRDSFAAFFAPLARCLESAHMIWIDYGFSREEYHSIARKDGTLRAFRDHRVVTDPLQHPGEHDLTAHVDFTAVAEAAEVLDGRVTLQSSQGAWLTQVARPWLVAMEDRPDAKMLRQFQTLTHPAHLGRAFQVIELSWAPVGSPDRCIRQAPEAQESALGF
jgi:SAM-dependent MidA family methyltransferase